MSPAELLDVARRLSDPDADADAAPSDSQLRRAVSSAYYAVFHAVLGLAAERFMGAGATHRPGYALLYRGFNHEQMRRLCLEVDKATMSEKLRRQLGREAVDPLLRTFATEFVALQQLRHLADYDPHARFVHSDAVDAVTTAGQAIEALDQAPPDDRADFLALLLANARG